MTEQMHTPCKEHETICRELRKGVSVRGLEDGSSAWEYDAQATGELMEKAAGAIEVLPHLLGCASAGLDASEADLRAQEAVVKPLEAPIIRPLRDDGSPEWQQIIALFERFRLPPPPVPLRDELAIMLAWARYGETLHAASSQEPVGYACEIDMDGADCFNVERNADARHTLPVYLSPAASSQERIAQLEAALDELEAKAQAQKDYFEKKQQTLPSLEDLLDDEGMLVLPDDISPLLDHSHANGRYSEADWWLSTIRAAMLTAAPERIVGAAK